MAIDPTLDEIGAAEAPASNSPFPVQDAGSIWIVERGKLDLFLVSGRNGQPGGSRYPVMRIEAGEAVFGVGAVTADTQLVASAFPQTKLRRVPWSRFRDLASLNDKGPALQLLDHWITHLSKVIGGDSQPGKIVAVAPCTSYSPGDKVTRIVASENVLWVSHLQGTSCFLSREPVASGPDQFFPISGYSWLEVAPDSVLNCVDSHTLFQIDSEGRALRAFHAVALTLLCRSRARNAKLRGNVNGPGAPQTRLCCGECC